MGEGGIPGCPAVATEAGRRPSSTQSTSDDLNLRFQPESLFHETRVTLSLGRENGDPVPPRRIQESGTHLSGDAEESFHSLVTDGIPRIRSSRLHPALSAALDGARCAPENLSGEAASWVPALESALDRWTRILSRSGSRIINTTTEASIAIARIHQARIACHDGGGRDPGLPNRRAALEGRVTATFQGPHRPFQIEASTWSAVSPKSSVKDLHAWDRIAEELIQTGEQMLEALPPPAMEAPAIFSPVAAGVLLHEICGHLLEADLVLAGGSPFGALIGSQVAPESVTLLDDPSLPYGRVHQLLDDEAEPAHTNVLIEDGRLAGLLSDHRSARATGGRSTGNGRRESYRDHPIPRMTNLILAAGSENAEDLPKSVDRGLLVQRLGRGQVDPRRGQFRLEVEIGRMIEGGRLGRPVTGAFLVGSCMELLAGIDGVGGDLTMDPGAGLCIKDDQIVPVGSASPSVRVSRVHIVPGAAP
jgi:hypothetical protein